jgi:hypothetical protein
VYYIAITGRGKMGVELSGVMIAGAGQHYQAAKLFLRAAKTKLKTAI